MMNYLQDKVDRFCNDKRERNVNVTMYDIFKEFEDDWWNISAVLYGSWLQKTTSDYQGIELSEQEW